MGEIIKIKKGMDLEFNVNSLAFGGMGVSSVNGLIVFIKNAIPGQRVIARITKKKSKYLEARTLKIIKESNHFKEVKCDHFDDCGGCTFQNLDYDVQLTAKELQIKEIFQRIGGFKNSRYNSIIGCDDFFHYRNKMEFTFSEYEYLPEIDKNRKPKKIVLGLHVQGRWNKILDINECYIQAPIANKILKTIKEITLNLMPYNVHNHKGYIRNVIIRVARNTNEIMINFVTSTENIVCIKEISDILIEKFPQITSVINSITDAKSGLSIGKSQFVIHGKSNIVERLGNYKFKISADSFFQTNTKQAEKMYDIILKESNLSGKEIVYDLFCGTGSIAIYISKYVKKVYGFELSKSAIYDAIENAKDNNIENAYFYSGDLKDIFNSNYELENIESPDVIILDPPRAGLHLNTVDQIVKKSPNRIIYVSCNPSTQARDISYLCNANYKLKRNQPLDMFPHTPHIENISTLLKKNNE